MELPSHSLLGRAVSQIAKRQFKTVQRPVDGEFRRLIHAVLTIKLHTGAPLHSLARRCTNGVSGFSSSRLRV